VLYPCRRAGRRGLDHLRREPHCHAWLRLEKAVDDPQHAEADAQQPARGRLRTRRGGAIGAAAARGQELAHADPGQGEHGEQQNCRNPLVQESELERRDNRRIVGIQTGVHSGHRGPSFAAGTQSAGEVA